jgi:hypothetical protein
MISMRRKLPEYTHLAPLIKRHAISPLLAIRTDWRNSIMLSGKIKPESTVF